MTSKTFVSGTVLDSAWLNDVNDATYAADTAPAGSFRAAVESSAGSSLVGYLPAGTGAVATDVQSKLRESVSVKDFGAAGDGVTDDTAAIQAAFSSGAKSLFFPDGTYLFNAAVNLNANSVREIIGQSRTNTIIKCRNDLSDITFFTVAANTGIRDISFLGYNTTAGTAVAFSSGTYTFSAHSSISNFSISNFNKGINATSWYNLAIRHGLITGVSTGIDMSPLTDGGDNGYLNCVYIDDVYFISNTTYDIHANPAIRISELNITNCIFDPGVSTAKIYLAQANPCRITNCYGEGNSAAPFVNASISYIQMDSCYLLGTGGILLTGQCGLDLNNHRAANSTDILNSDSTLTQLNLRNTLLPAAGNTLSIAGGGTNFRAVNSSVNGTSYKDQVTPLLIGDSTNAISKVSCFTKTITATIGANSSASLVGDFYAPNIFNGNCIGKAQITDSYNPGLILTVTPATTGSSEYLCVIATNTTASPITVTSKKLVVEVVKMETATAM